MTTQIERLADARSGEQAERLTQIRTAIRAICKDFPDVYWRDLDRRRAYPQEFVKALTDGGWLAVLIPERYGGAGLGVTEAGVILEEIHRSGGNAAACHAQMYIMGTVLRHGSEKQKDRYLPKIASGELRLQAFGVTEPTAGSETTRIQTLAVRDGDHYVVNGQKVFTSRAQHSDLMLLLCRTTPYDEVKRKADGISVLLVDLHAGGDSIQIRPIETMINHGTNEVFMNDLIVPVENRIGEEGKGFRYILDGMNAERILISSESIGDGRWFVDRASSYSSTREVFGRPIGANQGVQFPIAHSYAQIEAADLMRFRAAGLFDRGEKCGAEANMAKLLASEAAWAAANACLNTYGGYGFASEYDVERKFRECRLASTAPVNNNLVLAFIGQNVLGMPRSY
ncbi:MAG: acyl-CoA dehydrogenase family protein [Dehalococcoidia bacterium]